MCGVTSGCLCFATVVWLLIFYYSFLCFSFVKFSEFYFILIAFVCALIDFFTFKNNRLHVSLFSVIRFIIIYFSVHLLVQFFRNIHISDSQFLSYRLILISIVKYFSLISSSFIQNTFSTCIAIYISRIANTSGLMPPNNFKFMTNFVMFDSMCTYNVLFVKSYSFYLQWH